MNDITLLYYSACLIEQKFGENIRNHLLSLFPEGAKIISVTHKPVDFGTNIVVDLPVSIYSIYRQILIGAKAADTPYIGCCEDDAIYVREHFEFRPPKDTFAYNLNRWIVNKDCFFHRNRANMCMCIAPRELLIDTLETRFRKFPNHMTPEEMGACGGFGEPGRLELKMGLPKVKMITFNTHDPTLVFNHRPSVGGVRKVTDRDTVRKELTRWGSASSLWTKVYEKGVIWK